MTMRIVLLLGVAALCTASVEGQTAPNRFETVTLAAPTRSSPAEFIRVAGVVELGDGRVLVSDLAGDSVVVLSPDLSLQSGVGRRGRGPGEFTNLGGIFLLRMDTVLVEEPSLRRWRVVTPNSFLGPVRSEPRHAVDIGLVGVDASGRTLEVHPYVFGKRATGAIPVPIRAFAESLALIRRSRDGTASDTLAILRGGYLGTADVERTVAGDRMRHFLFHPLAAEDQAVTFADGWVAIARVEPYRIEWITPDGTRRIGPVRIGAPRVMTNADRQHAIDSRQGSLFQGVFRPDDFDTWPRVLPAFTNGALLALSSGNVLVKRERGRNDPYETYDEFDRRGVLVRAVRVPNGVRLVGSGRSGVFSVRKNSDDLEAVSLHPWFGTR